mmetsp:Transcript_14674/g.25077  ORF Transcript_14674/g.25077 Transcript_14674/m.25077 type:complete len:123 (-) Transcript_14674:634-1002(-)|eukprot:CAMPEP_0196657672 /NCGR_PEP_ID=MMETSP1086-20130531/24817_1 /TAXON_ID=77921 /ORGANISM="Cyanoptyche  gloeocystis , Strain SAG4.97" /LENGTH=122 /DNA_ID=CAMNT_0041990885 /DNA_START=26 /DNA_END=394 /DNA_ORIENTATION=+
MLQASVTFASRLRLCGTLSRTTAAVLPRNFSTAPEAAEVEDPLQMFFKSFGKESKELASKFESIDEVFKLTSPDLKKKGIPVKARKKILRQVNYIRMAMEDIQKSGYLSPSTISAPPAAPPS